MFLFDDYFNDLFEFRMVDLFIFGYLFFSFIYWTVKKSLKEMHLHHLNLHILYYCQNILQRSEIYLMLIFNVLWSLIKAFLREFLLGLLMERRLRICAYQSWITGIQFDSCILSLSHVISRDGAVFSIFLG